MFDLIGDIHGHADELTTLLRQLEYREQSGIFSHPDRCAVFVGDFIDRGPKISETVSIVQAMVDSGAAHAVMGNHEFNAIAYHTSDPNRPGEHLRPHSEKNNHQHRATLDQLSDRELGDSLAWFRTLPVVLELDGVRVVHACWDRAGIATIEDAIERHGHFTNDFMLEATDNNSSLFAAIENVLKGPEIPLPGGMRVEDKEGNARREMRIRWYEDPHGKTYCEYALSAESGFPDKPLPESVVDSARLYPGDAPPVFFGHYWLRGAPKLLAQNVVCLDYSVAKDGCLCAYRWSDEQELSAANFVTVAAAEKT